GSVKLAAAAIGPKMEARLFPKEKQAWLAGKLVPPPWNRHYDETLLSVIVPGVWYTVQYNQAHTGGESENQHVWLPTLTGVRVMIGVWMVISLVRGLVAVIAPAKASGPDPSRTRLGDTTVTAAPPTQQSSAGEDSVDY